MPDTIREAVVCFENVSKAILAEQLLAGSGFSVRVMPTPAAIRGGCGFCLRFSPQDLERAAAFLQEHGFPDTDAYIREETGGLASCAEYRAVTCSISKPPMRPRGD